MSVASLQLQQLARVSSVASPARYHLQNKFCGDRNTHIRVAAIPFPRNMVSMCKSSLASVAPIEAIFFDIDGTLCDSDPLHFLAFRQMLQEIGFNGGVPITEEFFITQISGKHNDNIGPILFPDWDVQKSRQFLDDKEALFRKLAAEEMKQVDGLDKLCQWITDRSLKRAAVTNAPRSNAELLLSMLGLSNFFKTLVIGTEWGRPKPCPDAYLKGIEMLQVSPKRAVVFEDSVSGIKAGIAAGMPVVGVALRNPAELLEEAGAVFTVKDFNDPKLWAALEELDKIAVKPMVAA
uniref:Haloacid dehalogenase-like hydrolase domain-containing protein Sgpp n=1 Tax=Kalanchoe fedtschenkoi TaxID=63787 RepID=A0A7N0V9E0_KALFE